MSYLFVLWLGENPVEKVFTSFRIILWSNVLNKLLNQSKNAFLWMVDKEKNGLLMDLVDQFDLLKDAEQHFLEVADNDQQARIEELLKNSKLIFRYHDNQWMVNIEDVEQDYLLKSSKETSSRDEIFRVDDNHSSISSSITRFYWNVN